MELNDTAVRRKDSLFLKSGGKMLVCFTSASTSAGFVCAASSSYLGLMARCAAGVIGLLVAAGRALGGDDFHQRTALPSAEEVEAIIDRSAGLTYENLDPMHRADWSPASEVTGSQWWEWQSPEDGWFTVKAVDSTEGLPMETRVSEGSSLEKLVYVANGNRNSYGTGNTVTFQA